MKFIKRNLIILIYKTMNCIVKIYNYSKMINNMYSVNQKNIKKASKISSNVRIGYPQNIFIGENTYINGGQVQASKNAKIIIGDNCLLSYNVHIRTDMHNYQSKEKLIIDQGHKEKDIIIDDGVWIGYGVQVMCGVRIGKGAIIGAGSIVTKDIPEYSIAVGTPARIIRYRS